MLLVRKFYYLEHPSIFFNRKSMCILYLSGSSQLIVLVLVGFCHNWVSWSLSVSPLAATRPGRQLSSLRHPPQSTAAFDLALPDLLLAPTVGPLARPSFVPGWRLSLLCRPFTTRAALTAAPPIHNPPPPSTLAFLAPAAGHRLLNVQPRPSATSPPPPISSSKAGGYWSLENSKL